MALAELAGPALQQRLDALWWLAVQAGVGIFFQQEADGSVYVKTVVSGGSAEREGAVRVGDMILAVDDREVRERPRSASPTYSTARPFI